MWYGGWGRAVRGLINTHVWLLWISSPPVKPCLYYVYTSADYACLMTNSTGQSLVAWTTSHVLGIPRSGVIHKWYHLASHWVWYTWYIMGFERPLQSFKQIGRLQWKITHLPGTHTRRYTRHSSLLSGIQEDCASFLFIFGDQLQIIDSGV